MFPPSGPCPYNHSGATMTPLHQVTCDAHTQRGLFALKGKKNKRRQTMVLTIMLNFSRLMNSIRSRCVCSERGGTDWEERQALHTLVQNVTHTVPAFVRADMGERRGGRREARGRKFPLQCSSPLPSSQAQSDRQRAVRIIVCTLVHKRRMQCASSI